QYQPDPIYAAAKHAVVGLTRALVFLKDEANIRVNCICPGVVDTPLITSGLEDLTPEQRAQHEAIIGRMALIQPGEVAEAVLALVRDDSLAGEAMGILYGRPPRLIPPAVAFSRDPSQQLPSSRAD
ncbi:MAG: SDR family oxidoreductase, partial [Dehalococcoidia bacterium]|nr:SDR family oxidoreductase [Dehalococcoidia bacterium]